jgi:SET domain
MTSMYEMPPFPPGLSRTLTQLLYLDPRVSVSTTKDGHRSVRATEDIPSRTPVIMELGVTGHRSILGLAVCIDDALFESLHPRGAPRNPFSCGLQVHANCFNTNPPDEVTIFNVISALNHSCKSNCFVKSLSDDEGTFVVFTSAVVRAGAELTITYNPGDGHDESKHDWKCGCGLSTQESRIKTSLVQCMVSMAMFKEPLIRLAVKDVVAVDPAIRKSIKQIKGMSDAFYKLIESGDVENIFIPPGAEMPS